MTGPGAVPPALFGPYGRASLAHAPALADSGANAVWFHNFDAAAFELCARHGLAPCVELSTLRADFSRRPDLVPIGVDGRPIRYGDLVQGVCLSKRDFLAEIESRLAVGLRAFRPTGIWLDYLTYAGWFEMPEPDLQESCFCPDCVAEFQSATGVDASTSSEILDRHRSAWTRHKCERVAGLAARFVNSIRSSLPGCVVGAYMCPWTATEYDGALGRIFAQDYQLLAPSIDVFTPLIYARKSGRPPEWGRLYLEQAHEFIPTDRKVALILDALDFPASLAECAEASTPSWGLQLFGGDALFADPEGRIVFRKAVDAIRGRLAGRGTGE